MFADRMNSFLQDKKKEMFALLGLSQNKCHGLEVVAYGIKSHVLWYMHMKKWQIEANWWLSTSMQVSTSCKIRQIVHQVLYTRLASHCLSSHVCLLIMRTI